MIQEKARLGCCWLLEVTISQFNAIDYNNYMTEQKKHKQVVRATLVLTKNPSSVANPDQISTSSRFSSNINQNSNQDYLTQNLKNFNITVKQLTDSLNMLTASLNRFPLKQNQKQFQNPQRIKKLDINSKQAQIGFQKIISKYFKNQEQGQQRFKLNADGILDKSEFKKRLELWTAKICNKVFQSAFQKFQKNQLSLQQAKTYCSQNIINNIVDLCLSQKQTLQEQHLKIINGHIKREICPYMLEKYPMTETNVVNKTLQSIVVQVDNIQSQKNNIFYMASKDCFGFQYRQSGNYNDLIMKFVNHLIGTYDELKQTKIPEQLIFYTNQHSQASPVCLENEKSQTLYEKFTEQMVNIFKTVYQVKQKNGDRLAKAQNQKKIQASWAIGRKIPENVSKYTERQITNMEFTIRSPSVLRILTKWCIELEAKFEPDYFLNNFDCIFSKGGYIIDVTKQLRESIDYELQIQSEEIKQYLKKIEKNNYKEQTQNLKDSIAADIFTNMEKTEQCCGLFSVNTVSNLHTYVILYLNRLIHGLLRVSKNVYESSEKLRRYVCVPNLLTFTICDLMRCRISSKEQEIRRVYSLIMKKSEEEPSLLKVVQVKNRLKMNTNDIQINFLFKQKYLCQMQLAVNSEQSHFMQCSNKFNHFIYQLKRSIFGPISELCSIRKSLDSRSKIYQRMAQRLTQQNQPNNKKKLDCSSDSKNHENLKETELPFKCSECGECSVNLSCFKSHLYCEKCLYYWRCGRCDLKSKDQQILKNQQLAELTKEERQNLILIKEDEQIPEYGVFFSITEKVRKLQEFAKLDYKKKSGIYIPIKEDNIQEESMNKQQKKFITFAQFKQKKCEQKFKKANIIFAKKASLVNQKITKQQIKQQSFKKLIEATYSKKKQQICIMGEKLTSQECKQIMKLTHPNQQEIKVIDLTQNKLTDLPFSAGFSKLQRLFLTNNQIRQVVGLQFFKKLELLYLDKNNLNQFPQEIFKLKELKSLNISNNHFSIIPERIKQLSKLQKLAARELYLKELPESFKQLTKIRYIDLENNELQAIPQILNIPSLEILALNTNKITQVKDWVFSLPKLRLLQLNHNKLTVLPSELSKMKKIQKLKLKNNQISSLRHLRLPSSMKFFDVSQNKVCQMDDKIFGLCNLQWLDLSKNNLSKLPSTVVRQRSLVSLSLSLWEDLPSYYQTNVIQSVQANFNRLKNIKFLYLSGYKLTIKLLQQLNQYPALQQLQLSDMQLEALPHAIKNMKRLSHVNFSSNKLSKLDDNFFNQLLELRQLNLQCNLLENLPSSLHNCKYLSIINISKNKIAELVLDFNKLKKLAVLLISKQQRIAIKSKQAFKSRKKPNGASNINNKVYKNVLEQLIGEGNKYYFCQGEGQITEKPQNHTKDEEQKC